MSLLLILLLVTLSLFALFWGGSLVAQGYLYNQPADRLPLRAAVAALVVGLYLTMWVGIDKRHPGRYDTFFYFSSYTTSDFSEFTAVRWTSMAGKIRQDAQGQPVETLVKFKRLSGTRFVEENTTRDFKLNDSTMMTAAILVKPNENGEPIRFNARLVNGNYPQVKDERRFEEVNGDRYVKADQLGVLYIPSSGVVIAALLLNFLLFVVWFVALWPVMRFSWGHSLGFAAVLGVVTMLILMPLLFKPNRTPQVNREPQQTAALTEPR